MPPANGDDAIGHLSLEAVQVAVIEGGHTSPSFPFPQLGVEPIGGKVCLIVCPPPERSYRPRPPKRGLSHRWAAMAFLLPPRTTRLCYPPPSPYSAPRLSQAAEPPLPPVLYSSGG